MSVSTVPQQRLELDEIGWSTYVQLTSEITNRAIRVTYDRGRLEIVSPSHEHERLAWLLGRMVDTLCAELGISIEGGRTTTFRRADLRRGLEPDACYWVQNAARVGGIDELDLSRDPAPDLVIEIDVHSRSIERLPIYAALGVPEIWRYADGELRIMRLEADAYVEREASRCFPWLPFDGFAAWLKRRAGRTDAEWIRAFLDWVRDTCTP